MTADLSAPDLVADALNKGDLALSEILKLVLDIEAPKADESGPVPTSVTLSPDVIVTLKSLVATLEALELPKTARELNETEKEDFTVALIDADDVEKAIGKATDKLKQVFQNHFDARAFADGRVRPDTRKNGEGFFVLDDKVSAAVLGPAKKVIRTVVEPGPVLTNEGLLELEKRGLISHDEYLKATRQTREVDEQGVMDLIKDRSGLLPYLAQVSKPNRAPYNQIRLVNNKE